MSDPTFSNNVRVLMRASAILADIRVKHAASQVGLLAFAGILGVVGVALLGTAGFILLEQTYGTLPALLICGGVSLFAALVFAIAGVNLKPGKDLELASDIQKSALDAVTVDVRSAGANVVQVASVLRNPFESALPAVIVPLIGMILKALRRGKS